jgi:ABC-type uncharacterized transport system auxiliary subunit
MRSQIKKTNFHAGFGEHRRMVSMRRTVTTTVFCLATLVILAGCGRVRYPQYYALNLPAPPDPPASENAHATLAIREFSAPMYLRQGAIAYKASPEQIGFYTYDRWAIDPRDAVTDAVIDRLRASGAFAFVKPYDGRPGAGYVLSGRLEKLDEVDYEGSVKVEIALSAQMTSIATGATVWSNAVSEVGAVNKRDVPGVVSAMDSAMERAVKELLSPMPVDLATSPAAKNNLAIQ